MKNQKNEKTCKSCKKDLPIDAFVDYTGEYNSRGKQCNKCFLISSGRALELQLNEELTIAKTIYKKYKEQWDKICHPSWLYTFLYNEFDECIYCGGKFIQTVNKDKKYLDHMDAISLGGEDSIRNAVFVCNRCNSMKRNLMFHDWLKIIPRERKRIAHAFYQRRHGYKPNDFILQRERLISKSVDGVFTINEVAGKTQGFISMVFIEEFLEDGTYRSNFIDPPNTIQERGSLHYFESLGEKIVRKIHNEVRMKLGLQNAILLD